MLKTLPAQVKAVESSDDGGDGIVEALVATYDLDSGGDRIVPGAFAKTLEDWQASGRSIPFIWSHMHNDIDAYLGDVIEASETDDGLLVKAQLDMQDDKTRKAFRLLKSGRVSQYSFAYEVEDAEEKDGEQLLKQLKLFEVGPTLIGMNQQTRTLVVKHDAKRIELDVADVDVKVGRVLNSANETSLRDAYDAIGRVLAQLDSQDESSDESQTDDAQPAEPEKADERASVKADEPMPFGPVDDDLLLDISLKLTEGMSHV